MRRYLRDVNKENALLKKRLQTAQKGNLSQEKRAQPSDSEEEERNSEEDLSTSPSPQ